MGFEILRRWNLPYTFREVGAIRAKEFQVGRMDGQLVFAKIDPSPEYVIHESTILEKLADVRGIPSLICRTSDTMYISYIDGRLLPEVMPKLRIAECMGMAHQIIHLIRSIHKRNIVHSDIRPWNFMYDDGGKVFLIDFEYAYERGAHYSDDRKRALRPHHGARLKTVGNDWYDTVLCVADLWGMSSFRVIRWVGLCLAFNMGFSKGLWSFFKRLRACIVRRAKYLYGR